MRTVHRFLALCLGAGLALVASTACGPDAAPPPPKSPNGAATPRDPDTCRRVEHFSDPLIVDWRPEERAELETVMRNGVAVVHYECDSLRLLKDCSLEGTYGFVGVPKKEQVLALRTDEELHANLPARGEDFVRQLGDSLKAGTSVDVGLVLVGRRATSRASANRRELKGACEGASHFVRRALVGAFAMTQGTSSPPPGATQLFAKTSSSSAKEIHGSAGDPTACNGANSDASVAPTGCNVPFRLELTAIDAPVASATELQTPKCPKGTVRAQGKCTMPVNYLDYECGFDDGPTCAQECRKGNAVSCGRLGWAYANGYSMAKDEKRAFELLTQSCDASYDDACSALGNLFAKGSSAAEANAEKARQLFERACLSGVGRGCHNLGVVHREGVGVTKDPERALRYFLRACDGGHAAGCNAAAELLQPIDKPRALGLYRRACTGDHVEGCRTLERLGAK